MAQSHSSSAPSGASAASDAGAAATASGAAVPLPFRQDEDVISGPAGMSILLLLIAAVVVLWFAARGRAQQPGLARMFGRRRPAGAPDAAIVLAAQSPLSAGVRLHVIRWEGGRVLAAVNAAGQVTVLQALPADGAAGSLDGAGGQ